MDVNSINQMMDIFMIIAGVLAVMYAITGHAPGFNTDYPKEMKADAEKMLRKFCWVVGPVVVVASVAEMITNIQIIFWISMAIIVPAIVVYIVLFRKKFKKYLKKMR